MNLNGRVFNPGELRTQVVLESRTVSVETGGFGAPTWATVATVKAKWENAHGNESQAAGTVEAELPATVTIRYRSGIDTTGAVSKGGLRYEILSVDNIRERNEYLELKVRRMRSG